jgi:hypothetical protein
MCDMGPRAKYSRMRIPYTEGYVHEWRYGHMPSNGGWAGAPSRPHAECAGRCSHERAMPPVATRATPTRILALSIYLELTTLLFFASAEFLAQYCWFILQRVCGVCVCACAHEPQFGCRGRIRASNSLDDMGSVHTCELKAVQNTLQFAMIYFSISIFVKITESRRH